MDLAWLSALCSFGAAFSVFELNHVTNEAWKLVQAGSGLLLFVAFPGLGAIAAWQGISQSKDRGPAMVAFCGFLMGAALMGLAKDRTAFLSVAAGIFASFVLAIVAGRGGAWTAKVQPKPAKPRKKGQTRKRPAIE